MPFLGVVSLIAYSSAASFPSQSGGIRREIIKQLTPRGDDFAYTLAPVASIDGDTVPTVHFEEYIGPKNFCYVNVNDVFYTQSDAREQWNELVAKGYNRG